MNARRKVGLIGVMLVLALAEIPCGECSFGASPENRPPVALAGFDRVVSEGKAVRLHGDQSYDPDGDDITFSWAIASAPPEVTLADISDPNVGNRFSAARGHVSGYIGSECGQSDVHCALRGG